MDAGQTLPEQLLTPGTCPGDLHLRDALDGPDFHPGGGLYYRDNFEQRAGRAGFGEGAPKNGRNALRLSVREHCPEGCEGCSERAEIWERTPLRVPYDRGVWYGFAVCLIDPIPNDDHRHLIAQWKREIVGAGEFSPFLALRLRRGKLFATIETRHVAPDGTGNTPVWHRPESNQMRVLAATGEDWRPEDGWEFAGFTDAVRLCQEAPLPSPRSGWIDLAVWSRPGPDGDGHVELYANGKRVMVAEGCIGHAGESLGENQYFKFGPYRAAGCGVWTVDYADFRRSARRADVLR